MKELLDATLAWPVLLGALLVFGFMPRAVLRILVLAFAKGDPRRAELLGELDAVPRWDRPLWVAEQVEVAICTGLGPRLAGCAPRYSCALLRIVRKYWAVAIKNVGAWGALYTLVVIRSEGASLVWVLLYLGGLMAFVGGTAVTVRANPPRGRAALFDVSVIYQYGGYVAKRADVEHLYRVSRIRERAATIIAAVGLMFTAPAGLLAAATHGGSRMAWTVGFLSAFVAVTVVINVDRWCQQRDVESATRLLALIVEPIKL